jgi:hypothetical protein
VLQCVHDRNGVSEDERIGGYRDSNAAGVAASWRLTGTRAWTVRSRTRASGGSQVRRDTATAASNISVTVARAV